MVTNLILIDVAIYVLDLFLERRDSGEIARSAPDLFQHPWNAWQLLTAGFIHSYDMWHILVNMLVLYFFGREVEAIYGRMEFLRIYLALIVLSSLAWVVSQNLWDRNAAGMMGASGGVMGIMVLYILHFPRRMIYIWGVFCRCRPGCWESSTSARISWDSWDRRRWRWSDTWLTRRTWPARFSRPCTSTRTSIWASCCQERDSEAGDQGRDCAYTTRGPPVARNLMIAWTRFSTRCRAGDRQPVPH